MAMASILEGAGAKVAEENEPKESKKNVTCEFCECVLFSDGSVKSRSSKAKKLQNADDEITNLKDRLESVAADLETSQKNLTDAKEALAAVETPAPAAEKKTDRWAIH